MALGHGSSSSKKHRKSRREGENTSVEESPKKIKTLMQAFWRRHSSSNASDSANNNSNSNTVGRMQTSPRTRTTSSGHSPVIQQQFSPPVVSSLEQALRIARGQVEDPEEKEKSQIDDSTEADDSVYDLTNDTSTYQTPGPQSGGGFLPRIPEHKETDYSAVSQMERLKASVVRRANSRSDRSELNSAPPGIYWPDGETPSSSQIQQPPPQHQNPAFIDRLPRIAPLSRPTSSVFFPGSTRSPATSFCASPARTVSPTPFLHRPLPPPPQQTSAFVERRADKMSKSFNVGGHSGPMWYAIPTKSLAAEVEVIDTTVYSNVKIPLLR
ncbi:hypothetical protein Aperf_G00000091493 [Anoplocephala perfoliata]